MTRISSTVKLTWGHIKLGLETFTTNLQKKNNHLIGYIFLDNKLMLTQENALKMFKIVSSLFQNLNIIDFEAN